MLIVKNKNPVLPLIIGLAVMTLLYFFLDQLRINIKSKEAVEARPALDLGRSYFSEAALKPLVDKYTGQKSLAEAHEPLKNLLAELQRPKDRLELKAYIEVNAPWDQVWSDRLRHTGVIMPAYPVRVESEPGLAPLTAEGEWLNLLVAPEKPLLVYFGKRHGDIKAGQATYLDVAYMGTMLHNGVARDIGLARELFDLPNNGIYPKMETDEAAHNEVVDSYDPALREEVQKVSSFAFHHYLAKVQEGLDRDVEALPMVKYYRGIMDGPDRYRGKVVEFTGSLIYFEKRKMTGEGISPGMDYFYECYLLDSNRLEVVFRTLSLPTDVKLKDVVTMRGFFLQRFMFPSRMYQKAIYVPMVVASRVGVVVEKEMQMTMGEKILAFGTLFICCSLFIYVAFAKPVVRGKKMKIPKKIGKIEGSNPAGKG